MSIQQMLFSFDGRLRRRDWWLWSIVVGVASAIINWVVVAAAGAGGAYGFGLASIVGFIIYLAFVYPWAALSVKRGHDRGRPTNVILGGIAVIVVCHAISQFFFAGAMASAAAGNPMGALAMAGPTMILTLISLVVAIWFLVDLGFLDGTPGPNQYGPSPKGLGGAETTAATV